MLCYFSEVPAREFSFRMQVAFIWISICLIRFGGDRFFSNGIMMYVAHVDIILEFLMEI